jgi:hypothetical protein
MTGLLGLLPVVVLLALLASGRYPGERVLLARRRGSRPRRPRRAARRLGSRGRMTDAFGPSGTALLAFKRAVRPPPLVVAPLG